jgi:hypothetical protein
MPSRRARAVIAVGLAVKPVGKPDAGNPHVRFDERGRETGCCRMAQATAPVLDSTPLTITTIVADLTASGVVAPFVIDGPMDGDAFRIYVEEVLAPELKPGQAVLMDNLSIHKVKGVKEAIQAAGREPAVSAILLA